MAEKHNYSPDEIEVIHSSINENLGFNLEFSLNLFNLINKSLKESNIEKKRIKLKKLKK